MSEFLLPSLGADMESARVVEWLVAEGDRVSSGDLVAVLETDKGAIDVEIFQNGVIAQLVAPLDVELPVGAVLALVDTGAHEPAASPVAAAVEAAPAAPPAQTSAAVPDTTTRSAPAAADAGTAMASSAVRASPLARRLAAEQGIDLAALRGSGPGGAVIAADLAARGGAARAARRGFDATAMRRAIGAAMSRSKREIPHYYLSRQVCLAPALRWLEEANAARGVADRLLPAVLLLRASALALAAFPQFNGHYEDERFTPAPEVNLGWAIALRGGGLVAPAIRAAHERDLDALMAALRDLVKRARGGGLRASELTSATATVTSLGERGAEAVWPVIHPPQVAMLGFGAVLTRPWVTAGRIAALPVVTLSLAADHRVSDGHAGSLLLEDIATRLAEPERL